MQAPYNRVLNKRGEISVYLALIFLVFLGLAFCVLEGIHEYGASVAAQDAVKLAGENVRAGYDRELFQRYHLFFLDPREREYIEEDGKKYLESYFSGGILENAKNVSLGVTTEKTAVDEDGLYLKHQIREWMKYREEGQIASVIKRLADNINQNDREKEDCLQETESGEEEIRREKTKTDEESIQESAGENGEDGGEAERGENEEEKGAEQEEKMEKERTKWKELVEVMRLMMKSGVLFYAVEHPETISTRSISGYDLPSEKAGQSSEEDSFWNRSFTLSLSGLGEITSLLSEKTEIDTTVFQNSEYYLVPYIQECFVNYGEEPQENQAETVLSYEAEYIIGGKSSDRDNLKAVANRILILRFITNYVYAVSSPEIKEEAALMAAAVTGFFGMPQAIKPAQLIIIGALCYGESMLELHALLSGDEISIVKNKSTWNLRMETALQQLKNKDSVKKGKWNVDYEDFLTVLLTARQKSESTCYRMMDLMQENTALTEPGFLLEESLFSWQWEGTISVPKYFSQIPIFNLASRPEWKIGFSRVNSY